MNKIMNNIYMNNIYKRYKDLKNSNKIEFNNNDLWKIFEYYSCIKLTEEYGKQFYEYNDIDPNFKEINRMSQKDTGIDCCDLENTIVQCKLRTKSLTYLECSTFFASSNIFSKELNEIIIRWKKLIITRNECSLSKELIDRSDLFIDRPYSQDELIKFCDNLILTPPKYPEIKNEFILRDYQLESINLIKDNKKNIIINLPTGTGKNSVIIYSFEDNLKYLILVPRIILMEQLYEEIIKHKPKLKKDIQLIGDNNNKFNENKLITICVYNSVNIIKDSCSKFEKIYIDEAHHINKPEIYYCDEELSEDSSSEESETYIDIIRSFTRYNNNIYLSATIDEIDNFLYYSKDIRSMIDEKYLCDYTIHIPIFNDDPTNTNICEYLLKYYRNIIIYCKSQKEGININKIMNTLQLNSSAYIDCNTSKKDRNDIIDKYKKGNISFLVNVKILVEGFDCSIVQGVCFLHLLKSQISLIQIIGRALRLDKSKIIANIILPFSTIEDENNISYFLKIIAKNDSRIRKSYINKHIGGYISIDYDNNIKIENSNILFKYEMIYNNIGILQNYTDIWHYRLEEVKKFMDINKERPTKKNSKLSAWLITQQQNYKNKKYIMKNIEIYNIYTKFIDEYKKCFESNEEKWINKLEEIKLFIDTNKTTPTRKNSKLSTWLYTQQQTYKNKKEIMQNIEIYNIYTKFIDEYKKYFESNEEKWINKLEEVKKYIDDNNARPNEKNSKILYKWISHQQTSYNKKEQLMKNIEIYNIYTKFIDKYKKYFESNEQNWINTLKEVKKYIDDNNRIPHYIHSKELYTWFINQKINYSKKEQIMKNIEIYNIYTKFIDKYKKYFETNEERWINILDEVKNFIDNNNKRPTLKTSKVLNTWLCTQHQTYKNKESIMQNIEIYNIYTKFIDKYKKYFESEEEHWINTLEEVKNFIDINNARPTDKNSKVLKTWLCRQKYNYKNKEQIMKNIEIYNTYTKFINEYKKYFKDT